MTFSHLPNKTDKKEANPVPVTTIWLAGFFVVFFLLTKELLSPFYFTQDDNHAQFLPKVLVGFEMIFSGAFPFIDNYQHFGAQLYEIGTYAILDPLMLVSYAVSKYVLNQPYATF